MAILYSTYQNVGQSTIGGQYYESWSDINNVIDSTANTYAEVTIPFVSENLWVYDNNIDTTSRVDYVLKVEVSAAVYSDSTSLIEIIGYNNTKNFNSNDQEIITTTTNTTHWIDITNLGSCPGFGYWDWDDIDDLSIQCQALGHTDGTATVTFYLDKLQLRITTQDDPIPIFGLRCYDSTANITLDTTDRITRVLYQNEVASLANGYEDIPIPEGGIDRVLGFAYSLDGLNGGLAHSVDVDEQTSTTLRVTWEENSEIISGTSDYAISSAPSLIIVLGW